MTVDYPTIIESETARLVDLAQTAPLDANVATCGSWSLSDLISHTSRVHRMAAAALRGDELVNGSPQTHSFDPASQSLADYVRSGLDELRSAIAQTDPQAQTWTFAGPRPALFWPRRMAAETAVHRWDAENAIGVAAGFDPQHAVDMIDEFFDVYVPRKPPEAFADERGRTLHLHANDADGEWVITRHPDHIDIEKAHAKSTTAVRGGASSLVLFVWNRPIQPDIEIFGDTEQLDDWARAFSF